MLGIKMLGNKMNRRIGSTNIFHIGFSYLDCCPSEQCSVYETRSLWFWKKIDI